MPSEKHGQIEIHARTLHKKIFQKTNTANEQLLKQIRTLLHSKSQHPAVAELNILLKNADALPPSSRLTPRQKHIIDEAFSALAIPEDTRAAFLKVIADLAKKSR